ncbi:hypothetical protein WJX73_009004 [Symbiochloris irregularis]|uniref:MIR domain-containing protein n=1 Tax=Symbiochloris irregularis TaxID=706552 RepID=A0AAW1PF65_9CHLO
MSSFQQALLLLSIALHYLYSAEASAALVTCGSVIKLSHARTSYLLHSHEIAYGSGSGQQSVTGYDSSDDANSLWIIRGLKGHWCPQGSSIKSGFQLRLQHASTRKFLHSHHFESPLSGQQEVSAFGSDTDSDDMDIWQVDWDKGAGEWTQDQQVRLRHAHTGVYLASGPQRRGSWSIY